MMSSSLHAHTSVAGEQNSHVAAAETSDSSSEPGTAPARTTEIMYAAFVLATVFLLLATVI